MRRFAVILLVGLIFLAGIQLAYADEDLFDIKAASAHVEAGITHLKDKKYDAAISELEEAVAIDPDAEAYYYLGYAYYMKGKKEDGDSRKKAIESFEKVYELDPGFIPGRFKPTGAAEPSLKTEPTETPESSTPETPSEPAAQTPAPSQSAEPAPEQQHDQQTSGSDNPSQTAPPFKATERVQHLPGY